MWTAHLLAFPGPHWFPLTNGWGSAGSHVESLRKSMRFGEKISIRTELWSLCHMDTKPSFSHALWWFSFICDTDCLKSHWFKENKQTNKKTPALPALKSFYRRCHHRWVRSKIILSQREHSHLQTHLYSHIHADMYSDKKPFLNTHTRHPRR